MGSAEIPVHPCSDSSVDSLFGKYTPDEFYARHGVQHSETYIKNARDMSLFTQSWVPQQDKVKGLVMVCHGYGADSSWMVQLTAIGFAERGYAVYAIDHQGHGKSEGLKGHIPDVNPVVDDCISFFESARKKHSPGLPAILYGESLGGALCLLIHLRQPKVWNGAILNGAMIGISDKFKPPKFLQTLLPFLAGLLPTWPLVPTKDIPAVSFKEPWKRALARSNPNRYAGKPRLATAVEMLRIVKDIEESSPRVTIPLLLVHGELDTVTDPAGSLALYNNASSSDKTMHIYDGMWHQLVGETPENMEIVFNDIYNWLETHSQIAGGL